MDAHILRSSSGATPSTRVDKVESMMVEQEQASGDVTTS